MFSNEKVYLFKSAHFNFEIIFGNFQNLYLLFQERSSFYLQIEIIILLVMENLVEFLLQMMVNVTWIIQVIWDKKPETNHQ